MARSRVQGGRKLKAWLKKAKTAQARSKSVSVGFFSTAKYPDGTPVAAVAAWNEFGTERIPERPFLRQSIEGAEKVIMPVLKDGIDPRDMALDRTTAGKVGLVMQARIQRSITELRTPANAPSTTAPRPQGKGSSNPLIDTGHMRDSVTYVVE